VSGTVAVDLSGNDLGPGGFGDIKKIFILSLLVSFNIRIIVFIRQWCHLDHDGIVPINRMYSNVECSSRWASPIFPWCSTYVSAIVTVVATLVLVSNFCDSNAQDQQPMDNPGRLDRALSHGTPSSALKVCVLVEPSPFTYISGYAGRFQNLICYLRDRGDEVQVVTAPDPDDLSRGVAPNYWRGIPVHYTQGVRLSPWYPTLILSLDIALKIPRVLWKMRPGPDLIHVSSPGFMVLPAVLYGRIFGVPVVASYHTHLPAYVRSHLALSLPLHEATAWLVWRLIRLAHGDGVLGADRTLVTSPQIFDEFVANGVPAHRCGVWRKGIDTKTFHPDHFSMQMRTTLTNNHPNDFLMLYVGRLSVEKRLTVLRRILEELNLRNSMHTAAKTRVRLCFVGAGPQEDELKALFAGTPTVFLGVLTGRELSQAFASCDVFVMPSESETLGLVVLESMASGVVPIAAKAGGLIDLIQDGRTGFLVEPSADSEEYAQRFSKVVDQLRHDDHLRATMGQRAREETLQWSWNASMESLREVDYGLAIETFRNRWEQRLWRFLTRLP
jgi:sulfoquinovosyltransferase